MRLILLIFVPIIVIFACALLLLWVPLPRPFPPSLSDGRNLMAAITTGILGLVYLVGLAVYVVSWFMGAGRALDPVLTSSGLTAQSYMVFGRQYRGSIQGRQVEVDYMPRQSLAAALLNVYVQADLGTRMAVGRQRPLLDCRDCPRLDTPDPGLSGLQVYAEDETLARDVLADPASRAALARLVLDQGTFEVGEVYVQPDRIWFRSRPRQITGNRIQQWLDDLLALAEAAERALA